MKKKKRKQNKRKIYHEKQRNDKEQMKEKEENILKITRKHKSKKQKNVEHLPGCKEKHILNKILIFNPSE